MNVKCNVCDILDKYFEYTNNHKEAIENEIISQPGDYRDISQDEKAKYVNNKLSKLAIHSKLQKLNLKKVAMDFGCTSLYPSAMWDKKSECLRKKED